MDVFTMVVLIVVIAVAGSAVEKYIKTRNTGDKGSAERDTRLAKLEERVRALEAVVTDHGYELKREFRELERS